MFQLNERERESFEHILKSSGAFNFKCMFGDFIYFNLRRVLYKTSVTFRLNLTIQINMLVVSVDFLFYGAYQELKL
jgi:hypothetical protein